MAVSDRKTADTRCLAIDLGAGSGDSCLVELGWLLETQEVGRFRTPTNRRGLGYQCWDTDRSFTDRRQHSDRAHSMQRGTSLDVDSWGVDYVLLDEA